MGRTITPKYVVQLSYISFVEKRRKTLRTAWNCRQDGRPTVENAKKYRDAMNKSLQKGGSNQHLNGTQSHFSTCTIYEQSKYPLSEVCRYTPPMFEVVN